MPLLKPGRWAWNPIEIEPQYRRLSEGLQVLLPFWDDNPINNLAPRAPVSPSAGFTLEHAIVSRPLRVGPSGLEVATQSSPSGEYIRTVETVSNQSPLNKSFSLVWVGRPDSIIDGGIRGWDGTKQIWLDALGGLLRIAFQGDSAVAYGSNCLQTVTLGSVVTIVLSSDWEGTRTKAWTSLYKAATTDQRLPGLALNVADRQTPTAGQKLYMGVSVNSTAKNFHGGVSLYGWWNRALTDTEATRLAADPFGLIRRHEPIELYGTGAGAQALTSAGTFTKAPTFPTGTVTPGAVALTGTVFQQAPTFPTGTITPGAVALTGTVFQQAPTFPTGIVQQVGAPQALTSAGTYTQAPTFPTGTLTATYGLTGTVYQQAPTFGTGTITVGTVTLTGTVYQLAPTFPTGTIAGAAVGRSLEPSIVSSAYLEPEIK